MSFHINDRFWIVISYLIRLGVLLGIKEPQDINRFQINFRFVRQTILNARHLKKQWPFLMKIQGSEFVEKVIAVLSMLTRQSNGIILHDDVVTQNLNTLISKIIPEMPKCIVVILSDTYELQFPTTVELMRVSPNSSGLTSFLVRSYQIKCNGYLVESEWANNFLSTLSVARLSGTENHLPRIIIVPSQPGNYSEDVLCHKEAQHIPDLITIELDGSTEEANNQFIIITNGFVGERTRKGEVLGFWPQDDITFFPDKIKDLKGKKLVEATVDYPPYDMLEPELDGVETYAFLEFCRIYNCSLSYITDDDLWGDVFSNGSANGIVGNIYKDLADFGAGGFYHWPDQNRFIEFAFPWGHSEVTVVLPKPVQVERWKTVFLPFTLTMWILQILSIITASIIMYIANKVAAMMNLGRILDAEFSTAIGIFFRAFGMSLLQPPPGGLSGSVLRSFFTSFEVLFLFFTTIYAGALSSVLTIPKYYPAIDTPMQLDESGIPWVSLHEAWIFSLREVTEPHLISLVKKFEVHEADTLISLGRKGGYGFCIEVMDGGHIPELPYLLDDIVANQHIMKEFLYSSHLVLLLRKGSPYAEKFNRLVLDCRSAGLFIYMETDVTLRHTGSRLKTSFEDGRGGKVNIDEPTILEVSHIQGAFILLGVGLSISSSIFFLEIIKKK